MKNLILLFLFILQILQVEAQQSQWYDLSFRTQNSETIFEGTILTQSSYIESESKIFSQLVLSKFIKFSKEWKK